jgi:hypothetical protein
LVRDDHETERRSFERYHYYLRRWSEEPGRQETACRGVRAAAEDAERRGHGVAGLGFWVLLASRCSYASGHRVMETSRQTGGETKKTEVGLVRISIFRNGCCVAKLAHFTFVFAKYLLNCYFLLSTNHDWMNTRHNQCSTHLTDCWFQASVNCITSNEPGRKIRQSFLYQFRK